MIKIFIIIFANQKWLFHAQRSKGAVIILNSNSSQSMKSTSIKFDESIRQIIPIKSSPNSQIIYYHRFLRCKSIRGMLTRA